MSYRVMRKFTCAWGPPGGPGSCGNLICSSHLDNLLAPRGEVENNGEGKERAFIHRGKSVHRTENIFSSRSKE